MDGSLKYTIIAQWRCIDVATMGTGVSESRNMPAQKNERPEGILFFQNFINHF